MFHSYHVKKSSAKSAKKQNSSESNEKRGEAGQQQNLVIAQNSGSAIAARADDRLINQQDALSAGGAGGAGGAGEVGDVSLAQTQVSDNSLFVSLPREIIFEIFMYLSKEEIFNLKLINKRLSNDAIEYIETTYRSELSEYVIKNFFHDSHDKKTGTTVFSTVFFKNPKQLFQSSYQRDRDKAIQRYRKLENKLKQQLTTESQLPMQPDDFADLKEFIDISCDILRYDVAEHKTEKFGISRQILLWRSLAYLMKLTESFSDRQCRNLAAKKFYNATIKLVMDDKYPEGGLIWRSRPSAAGGQTEPVLPGNSGSGEKSVAPNKSYQLRCSTFVQLSYLHEKFSIMFCGTLEEYDQVSKEIIAGNKYRKILLSFAISSNCNFFAYLIEKIFEKIKKEILSVQTMEPATCTLIYDLCAMLIEHGDTKMLDSVLKKLDYCNKNWVNAVFKACQKKTVAYKHEKLLLLNSIKQLIENNDFLSSLAVIFVYAQNSSYDISNSYDYLIIDSAMRLVKEQRLAMLKYLLVDKLSEVFKQKGENDQNYYFAAFYLLGDYGKFEEVYLQLLGLVVGKVVGGQKDHSDEEKMVEILIESWKIMYEKHYYSKREFEYVYSSINKSLEKDGLPSDRLALYKKFAEGIEHKPTADASALKNTLSKLLGFK